MPKRVKQHQLEDTSRHKFGLALPDEWVDRDKDKDYGIDVEVEIFDTTGRPTGLVYWVQLKATSSAKPYTIKNYNLNIDRLSYYKQLDIPVMIVRYSSVEDNFYCKWAHEIDPFTAKPGAKTVLVKYNDTDRWDPNETPVTIQDKLKRIKAIKQGGFSLPTTCFISIKDDEICGVNSGKLLSQLRHTLREQYHDQVDVQLSKESASMLVEVSKNELQVGIEGLFHCTFHAVAKMEPDTLALEMAKDIILGLAGSIAQMGYYDLAARVFFIDGIREKLAQKPDLLFYALPQLLKSHEVEKTIRVANQAADLDNTNYAEISILSAVLHYLDRRNAKQSAATLWFLKKCVQRNKKYGPEFHGIALYNMGNFYRSINENHKAIRCYLEARRYNKMYYEQAYFYSELAGLLFEIGKFVSSARYYKKSLEIEDTEWGRPLYADALMFSGQYQLAFEEFDKYLSSSQKENFEWQLKCISLEGLLKERGVNIQVRQKKKALKLTDLSGCKLGEERLDRINKALKLDLLCSSAWFNLGIEQNHAEQNSEAAFAFAMAGLINRYDPEAWANATACAFSSKEVPAPIVLMMINLGYRYGREEYVERLHDLFGQSGKDLTPLTRALEHVIGQIPSRKEEMVIRVPDPDTKGKMVSIKDYSSRLKK